MTPARDEDIAAVAAASNAFYAALSVLDDGTCMETVWANVPYVTYVGPDSRSVIVGWDAQKRYWKSFNAAFVSRSVAIAQARIHVVGALAWQIGVEVGRAVMRDGSTRDVDWIATNVFELIGARWCVVSHHAQPRTAGVTQIVLPASRMRRAE